MSAEEIEDRPAEDFWNEWTGAFEVLREAFEKRGFELAEHPMDLVDMHWGADICHRFQQTEDRKRGLPDTVAPVERVAAAVDELLSALDACEALAEVELPADRLNVSGVFLDKGNGGQFGFVREMLLHLQHASKSALTTGVRRTSGRPAKLSYDAYLTELMKVADEVGMFKAGVVPPRADFIELMLECEVIMPKELRANSEAVAEDRLKAAVKRAGGNIPAFWRI